ncbi:MAG: oxidoreductase [Pseudomonadota bacterium]
MTIEPLFEPFALPCGVTLKNRIIKSAMSDALGDGTGHPTQEQLTLYRRWAEGGAAATIIGEVQSGPDFAENPGNLVLNEDADLAAFHKLAQAGQSNGCKLWLQLGHAAALAFKETSLPKGPSALNLPELQCAAFSKNEIAVLPMRFARTASHAQRAGFGGVQIHAAHGFVFSQFLSPLFNKRSDEYGGSIANRTRALLATIDAVREAVGPSFPIAVKLNSSDLLEGGLIQEDALKVVTLLNDTSVDLIDISGGTYFPGAKAASDGSGGGPYFLEFAGHARARTDKPLMVTGGFKSKDQAKEVIEANITDFIGMARAFIIAPEFATHWQSSNDFKLSFPKFKNPPVGGVTAWFTTQIRALGEGQTDQGLDRRLKTALAAYDVQTKRLTKIWLRHFASQQRI